jgi:tetratricopeptide (TPR) repeat protein
VSLYTSLLSVMLATNSPMIAISNQVQAATGIAIPVVDPNDPAEKALHQLMVDDDAAMDEVSRWIHDNQSFGKKGAAESNEELNKRIHARFDVVRKEYEDFLQTNTNSARGYLAYGTFLNDIGEEDQAAVQYEKSKQIDPKNPAVWNNLANYYGEFSPVTNAFVYYTKAIELDPTEPTYYQNFATTVYLFRHDATNFYNITEPQVFDKALDLYRQAIKLAPDDLVLATDYAISYYEIHPTRTNDELMAWTNALAIAKDDNEREGVYVHLARIKISIGRWAEAQAHLQDITNSAFADMRRRLERNLYQKEREAGVTNSPFKS